MLEKDNEVCTVKEEPMRACLASLIFIFTITTAVAAYLDLPYWLLPPEQKFAHSWRHDLQLLERTKHFPEAWKNLNEVKFSSPDGFVAIPPQQSGPIPPRDFGASSN